MSFKPGRVAYRKDAPNYPEYTYKPSWKHIVFDEEERLCRQLDDVLNSVQAIKAAIQKGFRLEDEHEEGHRMIDPEELWCPEVYRRRMSAGATRSPQYKSASKLALMRMKDVKTTLSSISNSLDDAICSTKTSVVEDSLATGIDSLPDELLAQIFELRQSSYDTLLTNLSTETSITTLLSNVNSPFSIASVCKRFRRVAIQHARLWKDILLFRDTCDSRFSGMQNRLSVHASRCAHLSVNIFDGRYEYDSNWTNSDDEHSLLEQLDRIHPHHHWESLHLTFQFEENGLLFFRRMHPRVLGTPFAAMKSLSISVNQVGHENKFSSFTNLIADEPPSSSEATTESFRFWEMPNVTHIKLENTVPLSSSFLIRCPNVTDCTLIFDACLSGFSASAWDLLNLRDFLQSMLQLVSLTTTVRGEARFEKRQTGADANIRPLELTLFTSFSIQFRFDTPSVFIGRFMDIIPTPQLTKLSVSVEILDPNEEHRENLCANSVNAVFSSSENDRLFTEDVDIYHRIGFRESRHFTNVVNFSLDIRGLKNDCDSESQSIEDRRPSFEYAMYNVLPNVRSLTLQIPGDNSTFLDLGVWLEACRGLRDLREMHIREEARSSHCVCESSGVCSKFFKIFARTEYFDTFRRLVVLSPFTLRGERDDLERYLGDRLVWG